jgi:hypothetical protein
MPAKKTATLNLRIDPAVKEALGIAAAQEDRSVANMVEQLVKRHCKKVGISVPDQGKLFSDDD